ncbi:MAG: hypothetical protein OXI96_10310 [Acidimicrobiaceae bacterium]|nr:hypothetical protein [Acidimicrobiaceae bacterium]
MILIVASCTDSSEDDDGSEDDVNASVIMDDTEVVLARPNWDDEWFQAELYKQFLEELGYSVSAPAEFEMAPEDAYTDMTGTNPDSKVHLWVSGWYPLHYKWFEKELSDGSQVGDYIRIVGNEMLNAAIGGLLISRSFAEEYGITHVDQINDDPEILAAYDTSDSVPGNGKAEIIGCEESWTCDDVIESIIAFSGWDNIEQIKPEEGGYGANIDDAVQKIAAGDPVVVYAWGPTSHLNRLGLGESVVWLAVENVLDDSNPADIEGGKDFDQRPGRSEIDESQCPAAADMDGFCQLGWLSNNIQATANIDWLNANPNAAELLCVVQLPIDDVLQAIAEISKADAEAREAAVVEQASDWIAENRTKVDGWLDRARNAVPETPSCPATVIP